MTSLMIVYQHITRHCLLLITSLTTALELPRLF